MPAATVGDHGKLASSKYTSEVTTMRKPGTLMPTQARGSMRVLEMTDLGLTAKALQPKGMMPMIEGLTPVTISIEVCVLPGGVDVRFKISTAC
eukprot:1382263-Pleurochrysis_carterae.AAC.4